MVIAFSFVAVIPVIVLSWLITRSELLYLLLSFSPLFSIPIIFAWLKASKKTRRTKMMYLGLFLICTGLSFFYTLNYAGGYQTNELILEFLEIRSYKCLCGPKAVLWRVNGEIDFETYSENKSYTIHSPKCINYNQSDNVIWVSNSTFYSSNPSFTITIDCETETSYSSFSIFLGMGANP